MNEASPDAQTIARELAALGEDTPSEAELAVVGEAVHDTPEVAMVERLSELSEPVSFEPLSELELHRVWRGVEQRLDEDATDSSGPSKGGGPSPTRWPFAVAGLAAAAVVALLVIPRGSDPKRADKGASEAELSATKVAEQGEVVRAALAALDDGRSDTARAQDRLAAYRDQLEEQGG